MDKQQEYVLRAIEERDISFIRLWFTDVSGQLKSVAIAPAEVESAFEEGIGFDGSAIEGLTRVFESDMLLAPDPSTFQMLPWRDGDNGVARMFCDVLTPDGEPARTDPRSVLERQLARVAEAGFTCYIHPEIEFYLVNRDADGRIRPTDDAGYFDHVPGAPPTTSAATPSSCSSRWGSRCSSPTMRVARARTRSICASPTPCRWRTTS